MFSAIRYQLCNFKNVKNTHGGMLLLVKLQAFSVFLTFFKLYKWYQITQRITFISKNFEKFSKSKNTLRNIKISSMPAIKAPEEYQ